MAMSEQHAPGPISTAAGREADPGRGVALRYGLAVAAVAVAVLARHALHPVVGPQFPYATVYFAVLFAAWYGGAAPGVVAMVVGGLAALYLFVPPYHGV